VPAPVVVDGSSIWKLCENHQDGKTPAKWSCQACAALPLASMLRGPVVVTPSASGESLFPALLLCDECDGFMHLAPTQKRHHRDLLRLGVSKVCSGPGQQSGGQGPGGSDLFGARARLGPRRLARSLPTACMLHLLAAAPGMLRTLFTPSLLRAPVGEPCTRVTVAGGGGGRSRCAPVQTLSLKFLGDDCVVGRLPWLQVTVYPSHPKAIVELKEVATSRGGVVMDTCRFCEEELDSANRCKVCKRWHGNAWALRDPVRMHSRLSSRVSTPAGAFLARLLPIPSVRPCRKKPLG
jgi:hypothetical protein